jgi:hypothetical protein
MGDSEQEQFREAGSWRSPGAATDTSSDAGCGGGRRRSLGPPETRQIRNQERTYQTLYGP